jgi:acyl-CoA synthetase (AMP-forming)/AMP-acid ligase II
MRERPEAENETLVSRLRRHSVERPDLPLYTYLGNGEAETESYTCGRLDLRARAVAAALAEHCRPGDRALLLFPPGLEFLAAFVACLYSGVAAVPAYPPNPNQSLARLQGIVVDAAPSVVLATSAQLQGLARALERVPELSGARWLATDAVPDGAAAAWAAPRLEPGTLAFLQYTSGSTGAPRGVMVTHGNLVANERIIEQAFDHGPGSRVMGWLPLYHDMGLIGNALQPLYLGIPCVLMSPVAFLQRPVRWLAAISRYRSTTSGGPNFAYDQCVRRITPGQCTGLDLGCWDLAYNGSEQVRPDTLRQFAEKFAPCGFRAEAFYPCYGMAEFTLLATGGAKAASPVVVERGGQGEPGGGAVSLAGCGHPWGDTRLRIVDPASGLPVAPGTVGEVWVAGGSVAAGYWQRAEESASTFGACLAGSGEGPYLRTGDLGFVEGGELFIAGRLKELIKIRGRNYYPQDIELTAERSHPALRPHCGAAFSVTAAGEEALVVVHEVERKALRGADIAEIAGNIVEAIATEHGVKAHDVVLVAPGAVPKTSSGKIQRNASRAAYLDGAMPRIDRMEETASHA